MRLKTKAWLAYAVLLAASYGHQALFAPPDKKIISYRDSDPYDETKPIILLLHGSPIAAELFDPLIAELRGNFRLIAPSLPGFGESVRTVADYSIRSHAVFVRDFLSRLDVSRVHVVGYSMGSGVAIEFAHQNPRAVLSLTLLSGIGVQEHELLGNYQLNHLLHGVQWGLISALNSFVPHFGLLEKFPLNTYYARNFLDTDQRPLRLYLTQLDVPALILHGGADFLVPVAAARGHARLAPLSELRIFPAAGHMLLVQNPKLPAQAIESFISRVAAGTWQENFRRGDDIETPHDRRWFILWLLALATLLSEDLSCIAAGLLAAAGSLNFVDAVFACFLGILVGDLMLVAVGRIFSRYFSADKFIAAKNWLDRRGVWAIVASRFVPGTRLPLYLAVGFFRIPIAKTFAAFVVACALWTPLLVGVACFAGARALTYLDSIWRAVLILAIVYILIRKILLPAATWRGRRLLYSSYVRTTRWEFWPALVFYFPFAFYFIYLVIRYRSFTVFTAANPAMPDGGVIGESKSEILRGLDGAGKAIARFSLVTNLDQLRDFMRGKKLKFPVVLKPDVGERGNGVAIVHNAEDAVAYFVNNPPAVIAQEYIPGLEFGVFYYRYPSQKRGQIFAITDKRFPKLLGDGVSTLETLILRDARAVAMARYHLKKYEDRLTEVIRRGEEFPLVELGTHCKGSLFLDGIDLKTAELETAIDKISQNYAGFHFGRYDIRVPSLEDFQRGKNLKIVELNGVTSEATSIYDPKHSLLHAYRVLARQWRLAFEIGYANAQRGAKVTPPGFLLRKLLFFRRKQIE